MVSLHRYVSGWLPVLISTYLTTSIPLHGAEPSAAGIEFFEKKVRPLLITQCYDCHSTGKKKRGGLLLDSKSGVLKGGDNGPIVVPGKPELSRLIQAVGYKDDLKMPKNGKLADEQIAVLTEWVKMGAPQPDDGKTVKADTFDLEKRRQFWSFQPIKRVAPPEVKDRDWPTNEIDRFILGKLEAAGLRPAAGADKRTFLRRVTFDLIGLPPTPAEIDAFLADNSPQAYEKVVDRLLASPAHGERWARHWLDLVRFAETLGHEFDFEMPEAHLYRDYVIRALNADVPYDQFVMEHIAGDLMPKPRRHPTEGFNESILGTGFWFLGEAKHSPVDLRGDGADRRDNQIDVFAKTFLGLTVSCARCHDHKFDPIPTKDYYSLASYLQSSRFQRAFLDDPERIGAPVRKLKELQRQANPLAVALSAKVLAERLDGLSSTLLAASGIAKEKPAHLDEWLRAWRPTEVSQEDHLFHVWQQLADPAIKKEEFVDRKRDLLARFKKRAESVAASAEHYTVFEDFRHGYRDWFVTGDAFGSAPSTMGDMALHLESNVPVRKLIGPHRAHSGLVSPRLQGDLRSRTFTIEKKHILYRISGRGARVNLIIDGFQQIRDPIYGVLTFPVESGDRPVWIVQNVGMWVGLKAYIEVLDDGNGEACLDRVLFSDDGRPSEAPNRLWVRLLEDPAVDSVDVLARKYQELLLDTVKLWRDGKLPTGEEGADRVALLNAILASPLLSTLSSAAAARPSEDRDRLKEIMSRYRQEEAALPLPRRGMAMADGTGVNEYVHIQGLHKNHGPEAPRRFLTVLAGDRQPAPEKGSGRLELARRMLDGSDPLLPRVIVNRLWHHHFGKGLVASPDDFGVQGQRPTHPELLDWLASEFVKQGWSLKKMHRLMVLSSAYRMASRSDAKTEEADPLNNLLHRMPIRRLEAEAIRDSMLAVSGRLDRTMYGRGPLPYLTEFSVGRGRPSKSGTLDGDGRRSIYLNVRRNFLNPMFLAFDYPIPFTTIGRRSVSNVPAQALTMLNNPFVIQQAERWSKRVLDESGKSTKERITSMYVTAFGRPPTDAETKDALTFLEEQSEEYGKADDPRAWADLCHVLFNVKEFIFLN
jgi:hypothetical protein